MMEEKPCPALESQEQRVGSGELQKEERTQSLLLKAAAQTEQVGSDRNTNEARSSGVARAGLLQT